MQVLPTWVVTSYLQTQLFFKSAAKKVIRVLHSQEQYWLVLGNQGLTTKSNHDNILHANCLKKNTPCGLPSCPELQPGCAPHHLFIRPTYRQLQKRECETEGLPRIFRTVTCTVIRPCILPVTFWPSTIDSRCVDHCSCHQTIYLTKTWLRCLTPVSSVSSWLTVLLVIITFGLSAVGCRSQIRCCRHFHFSCHPSFSDSLFQTDLTAAYFN